MKFLSITSILDPFVPELFTLTVQDSAIFVESENVTLVQTGLIGPSYAEARHATREILKIDWSWGVDGGLGFKKPQKPYYCIVMGHIDPLNTERPELASSEPQAFAHTQSQSDPKAQERAKKNALLRSFERAKDPSYQIPVMEEARFDLESMLPPKRIREKDPLVKDTLITQVDKFRRRKRRH